MIFDFIDKAWSWVVSFFDSLFNVATWFLDSLVYIASHVPLLLFKISLDLVLGVLSTVSLSLLPSQVVSWVLPPALAYLIGQTGIDIGLTMLAGAYSVRWALNLIPSWITRV